MSKKEIIITVVIAVLAIALIATVIVAKKMDAVNNPTTPSSSVAHDHDGDGVADHDDSAHETQGSNSGSANGVVPEDGDVDVSIDLEDLPDNSGGTTEPTTGNTSTTEPTTGNTTEPTTGNESTTEPTTGTNSGAVSGNEIDMDDLINAGRN